MQKSTLTNSHRSQPTAPGYYSGSDRFQSQERELEEDIRRRCIGSHNRRADIVQVGLDMGIEVGMVGFGWEMVPGRMDLVDIGAHQAGGMHCTCLRGNLAGRMDIAGSLVDSDMVDLETKFFIIF